MPKTKDAFAFAYLSVMLEETIGEFSIPKFAYEPCSDDEENDEFKAFCAIADWINVPTEKMPPYRGFSRVKHILAESNAELKKLQFILDRIDVHITRLRRYLLTVSKKILTIDNLTEHEFWEYRKDRASFLLWHYEWFKDVLTAYSAHVEKHIESQEKNLQQQYKAEFAERLREARRRKKINQADVAVKLGLTSAAYSNYERGLRDLPLFTIYRLTEILEVSADYLFGIEKKQN